MGEELGEFLARHVSLDESEIVWVWEQWSMQLRIRAYLTREVPPHPYVTAARGLIFWGDRVLVTRNRDATHITPGGRLQPGETMEDALRREVLEETGVTVKDPVPLGFLHFHHLTPKPDSYPYPYPDFLQVVYAAQARCDVPEVRVSDPDDYELEAAFYPITDVEQLPLSTMNRLYLAAALEHAASEPVANETPARRRSDELSNRHDLAARDEIAALPESIPLAKPSVTALDTFPILETPRLILREMTLSDAPALFALFSDPRVAQAMDTDPFERIEQAGEEILFHAERFHQKIGLRWGITRKGDDTIIGTAGVHRWDRHARRSEIGYDLEVRSWGQGLATEAVGAIIRYGFEQLDLNRIEATTNLYNVASMKVLSRLGFTEEGILREYGYWRDTFHDLRIFSLLRREYSLQYASL